MSKIEKLGSFLLFEKLEEDKLSKNYLAGQIVSNQIQQICIVKKFDHSLSTLPDFILDLNQEFEVIKALSNPNIVKPNLLVQDKNEFAAVFDYVEGKSLRAVLQRCTQEGYPFTVDHTLLIGSRLCTALEYLHSKKVNDQRLVHGVVAPETILVSYDGEIKLQYLGLSHTLLKFPAGRDKLFHDYKNYMAPEVISGGKISRGADVYGSGLVLYEMLTSEPLYSKSRDINVQEAVDNAHMFTNAGDKTPVPDDIKKVLGQALHQDPAQRYGSIADMRKALDLLLFSSEFSPTTFNLAFFMHSLFRENIDEENKNIISLKKFDVTSIVKEEPPPPPPKPEHPVGATPASDIPAMPVGTDVPAFGRSDAFDSDMPKEKSKAPIFIGAGILVAVLGVIGLVMFPGKKGPDVAQNPQPQNVSTMTPEQKQAAEAERNRLQDEAKKAQEEAQAKDVELQSLKDKLDQLLKAQEQQAKKDAAEVDTAAIKKLQEEAKRLEEEKRKSEQIAETKMKEAAAKPAITEPPPAQVAELKPPANTTANPAGSNPTGNVDPAANTANPPPVTTTPPPVQAPQVREGDLVQLGVGVTAPVVVNKVQPSYPPIAAAKKIEGTVILSLLVNETGTVSDVKVLRGAGGSSGLNEAATAAAKKWKFRPAIKEGKRVKVWMTQPIVFKAG